MGGKIQSIHQMKSKSIHTLVDGHGGSLGKFDVASKSSMNGAL